MHFLEYILGKRNVSEIYEIGCSRFNRSATEMFALLMGIHVQCIWKRVLTDACTPEHGPFSVHV